jgi:hypothetical protein
MPSNQDYSNPLSSYSVEVRRKPTSAQAAVENLARIAVGMAKLVMTFDPNDDDNRIKIVL